MRHRAFPLFICISAILIQNSVFASYCGVNGVPYSLEILSDGSPVLGCAQPTCMAEPVDDYEDSNFISNAAGQEDGFFREGDRQRKSYSQSYKPKAECPGTFSDLACTKKNQWVGGIDFIDHPRQPLVLQCCTFEGLRFSQDVGETTISAGEAVTGGEVIRDGRQISFDVIANIRRLVDPDDRKRTYYEVTVRRINCLPDPPEFEVAYDDDVESEISKVLGNATNSAMNFGHDGHPHMAQEKKISKRPYKRKPKTSSTHNVISPLAGHEEREPFIGSFGAPIFNPTSGKHSEEVKELGPRPFTRRILTPKPRIITTTTTQAPVTTPATTTTTETTPVRVQVEPVVQTLPNPFAFQPLPPFPPLNFLLPQFPQPASPPAPPPPPAPAVFGVSQTGNVPPLHPQFGLFTPQQPPQPQPFGLGAYGLNPAPTYGLQPQPMHNEFGNLDIYTQQLLTNPTSPFALQVLQPQQFAPQPQQYQQQSPSQQTLQRVSIQAPQRENSIPVYNVEELPPSREEQLIGPKQTHLGQIYRAPPFSALGTTLYNFRTHNG